MIASKIIDKSIGNIGYSDKRKEYYKIWEYHNYLGQMNFNKRKYAAMKKKLKKIPVDLVSYIQIETEAIRDANDKMMISSYCLSKLELVNWYIELLEVGSKKYIVPQSKEHLEMIRDQLIACHKQIMNVKIANPNSRPIIDIKYPKGYEG